jgi:hypothetical protein
MTTSLMVGRRDLHNTSVNFDAAIAGQCGFTHIASGRVCRLPHRHPGPCDLPYPSSSAIAAPAGPEQNPLADAATTVTEHRGVTSQERKTRHCEEHP